MRIINKTDGPQYMIAAVCGMSPSRLSEYCLLQRDIPMHHMLALCDYLKCNPDDILGIVEEPESVVMGR